MFDGKPDLLSMQRRRIGPHMVARGKSKGFSCIAAGTWGMFSIYGGDGPSIIMLVQRRQVSCLVERDTLGFSLMHVRPIGTPLEVRRETQGPFPVATWKLGFLSVFKRSQSLAPFKAFNSVCLSSCQRNVTPPVNMRQGTKTFPSISTGDSDVPSSCEMKDEPAFKSVQGNQALF